jgi:hypothetical protein
MKVDPESFRGLATAFGVRTRPRVALGSGGALESDAETASHSQSTSCEMPLTPSLASFPSVKLLLGVANGFLSSVKLLSAGADRAGKQDSYRRQRRKRRFNFHF